MKNDYFSKQKNKQSGIVDFVCVCVILLYSVSKEAELSFLLLHSVFEHIVWLEILEEVQPCTDM